ncbi:efflux RND transporter permease subunit [Tumebacillus flagellatus]|uniref:RND superfamily resistance-nodulation-cell division acriflavin:proton (H+) antiporter n=1 Tax=Tumebacillus flagellatus TaxID=1157490 RepID=A0A074MBG9_9BACL|nr:efflux RND transporter permease subunit [Tumebacillus flagellatus]KEO83277.1 RND superfamily resistance-nodulation-cell division acriflavin:proton (H+) antiporter [Tumebacillus flagellatus]
MSLFTKFSLKNPVAIVILCILIVIGAGFSVTKFRQEQLPDVNFPSVTVQAVYPGASPNDVLNEVTVPLETVLRNVPGVKNVTSQSQNNFAMIALEFSFKDNMDEMKKKVEDAIANVKLPSVVENPKVSTFGTSNQAILYSAVQTTGSTSQEELNDIVKNRILPQLKSIDGVADVKASGLVDNGVYIQLNTDKLQEKHLSFNMIQQALQANNLSIPLGEATLNQTKEPVIISGKVDSVDNLKNIVLMPAPNKVTLGDVADIKQGKDVNIISRTNGAPSIGLDVYKASTANTVAVSEKVLDAYKAFDDEGKVKTLVEYDRSSDVKESVFSMAREGGLGALFASILILLFLRNFRATLIAIVSIPLSIMISLITLKYFSNVTLNIMTLGGMAVATGRVVDDSIVVIENIVRRLQQEKISKDLLLSATREVGGAITASTITTVAVFAPLGLLQGISGEFFAPFALTVACSLLASLVVALTVVPLLAWGLMRKRVPKDHVGESGMSRTYKRVLNWSLNHKATVLILSVLLFVGTLPLTQLVGVTFLPETENKFLFASVEMPKGTALSSADELSRKIDTEFRNNPAVETTHVSVGQANGTAVEPNYVNWFLKLKSDTDTKQFMEDMKAKIKVDAGTKFEIMDGNGGGASAGIDITVTGGSAADRKKATEDITAAVKKIDGTSNVTNNLQEGTKGIELQVRAEDALKNGMTVIQASSMLRPYLTESQIGKVGDGKSAADLFLTLKGTDLTTLDAIGKMTLDLPTGKQILVKDIADVNEVQLPGKIQNKNGDEYSSVTGTITSQDTNGVNVAVDDALKAMTLPNGVKYSLGGASEDIQNMMSDMMLAMSVALGMVYIVMVISFGEGRAPFAILFSLPFALVGGLLGTIVIHEPISISSLIGFLMLIGIVVTNAIVLIDRVQHQIKNGLTIREALLESGGTRLRPILMTAIATIFALLPLALGIGSGSIISRGLGAVVIGGLVTSTLLTLVVVPVMYELLNFRKARAQRRDTVAKVAL